MESVFERFNSDELAMQACYVPFIANRVPNASVVWLNRSWFSEQGYDLSESYVATLIKSWLLRSFAYVVPGRDVPSHLVTTETTTLLAERYGSTGASPNGGGGRAGLTAGFCVKGVGRTPLIGRRADWTHSHGCLFLEEALREALISQELSRIHPTLPSVAVIDVGISLDYRDENSRIRSRRGLLVRPIAVRLAHLERAVFFKPVSAVGMDQVDDAHRTRLFVEWFMERACSCEQSSSQLASLFRCLAATVALSHAHRIFHGGLYSANATLTGELLDFGGTRILGDWKRVSFSNNDVAFGDELTQLRQILKSVCFYISKYSHWIIHQTVETRIWIESLKSYSRACEREVRILAPQWCSGRKSSQIRRLAKKAFIAEQTCREVDLTEEQLALRSEIRSSKRSLAPIDREDLQDLILDLIRTRLLLDG